MAAWSRCELWLQGLGEVAAWCKWLHCHEVGAVWCKWLRLEGCAVQWLHDLEMVAVWCGRYGVDARCCHLCQGRDVRSLYHGREVLSLCHGHEELSLCCEFECSLHPAQQRTQERKKLRSHMRNSCCRK